MPATRRVSSAVLPWVGVLLLAAEVRAERLPIKAYSTANGLAHNTVNKIVRDTRGFLWFATDDGLSRFDGYGFVTYSVEQGLPHRRVTDLLETRDGELWVATSGGLVRFRPEGAARNEVLSADDPASSTRMFSVIVPETADASARAVTVLLETRDGTLWCGTRKGLFRLNRAGGRPALRSIDIGFPDTNWENSIVNDLIEDESGSVWIASPSGLYRRWLDGSTARYTIDSGLPSHYLHDLFLDGQKRLWIGSRGGGFFHVDVDGSRKPPIVRERYDFPDQLNTSWVFRLAETSDGRFWAATNRGLAEFAPPLVGEARQRGVIYTRRNGLSHQEVTALAEDMGGNLWLGTGASGAMKLARTGFVTYGDRDGLISINDVFEDGSGSLFVMGSVVGTQRGIEDFSGSFGRFDGRAFQWFVPAPPFAFGWVYERNTVRTIHGEWWLAGGNGINRFQSLPRFDRITAARALKVYSMRDGLAAVQSLRLFADSRGDVWVSSLGNTYGLARWEHATATLRDMAAVPGFPSIATELPRAFGEDASGNVWVGVNSGVARYRNGRFAFFGATSGFPYGTVETIYSDASGRLWLGTARDGLVRVDDVSADRPTFAQYTTVQGLSSNTIAAITADTYGRLYVATSRGIDQFEPVSGRVRLFTTDDGLAPGVIITAYRDRTGTLWFGTHGGLSRFTPPSPGVAVPPAILITQVKVAGKPRPVSAIGEHDVALADLPPDGNPLEIEFVALGFAPGENLQYQYQLEGSDRDWAPPTRQRRVSYASLSPGRYRFLVRAINADGVTSTSPAVIAFTVLAPIWLRWWFLSLAACAVAGGGFALHRAHLSRTIEIERVRMRIATDLHDDVGANLTRIAILSEVARQQSADPSERVDGPLSSIADIARESAAAMGDIVWAINPARDRLHDMVRKMRDHAEDVFESRDIALTLDLPDNAPDLKLGVDVRRDLYLIFKEAVNNAARHSRCSRVSIAVRIVGSTVLMAIADDGIGFDASAGSEGNGLASMRRRAERLGASLEIGARPGSGTTVSVTMPIADRWGGFATYPNG
jgi:ligand-binding sensor domain-containing protein/two-component sensor histidine kinase